MSGTSTNTTNTTDETTITRYTYRYHNDSLGVLNILLLGIVILIALLGFFIFVQLGSEPKPLHFTLNKDLQIITPIPLDQEGISKPALLNWVDEFVMKAFSFNYSNIQKQNSILAPYFSDAAMKVYNDLLTTDEDFLLITSNHFVVSITPKAAPQILVAQAFKGRYAWQIEIPVEIVFSNALLRAAQTVVFDFLIWRVPENEAALGVSVATFTHKTVDRTGLQGIKHGL